MSLSCLVLAVSPAGTALAGTRTINFDDAGPPPPDPAPSAFVNTHPLTDRYAARGVSFSGPEEVPAAPSSMKAVASAYRVRVRRTSWP